MTRLRGPCLLALVMLCQAACRREPAVESVAVVAKAAAPAVSPEGGKEDEEWWKKTGHPRGKWWLTYPGYEPEAAEQIWKTVPIPPSPVLSAEEALDSFRLPEDLEIQVVASEPMIVRPVFIRFDAAGRLWVVEMPGYMRDIYGAEEEEPSGRVVVLEDLDGDGRMDKSTTFLDRLVMPRTIAFVEGGVLVAEPPRLWYARDKDGDLVAEEKVLVASDYGEAGNPEHSANGLLPAIDNWMYSAKSATRYRFAAGELKSERTHFRGQWGISQDDTGRLYYNYNASPLHTELVPGHYLVGAGGVELDRNRNLVEGKPPVSLSIMEDVTLYPARVAPLVTLGASDLRPDGTLKKFSAACAPLVYRGNLLGADFRGDVFVCDPVGNLVARFVLPDAQPPQAAARAYPDHEFLTSTDERFRPVALETGPDGALYLADMYTGIIEHKRYVTEYLRKQVLSRDIGKFTPTGRIYRIVPKAAPRPKSLKLADRPGDELIDALGSDNGWMRDTAQRLLVERRDPATIARLKAAATGATSPLARLHALWACDGVGALDFTTLRQAATDADPRVRAAAVRLSENIPTSLGAELADIYASLAADNAAEVKLQLMLSLSRRPEPWAARQFTELIEDSGDWWFLPVVAAACNGRELELFERLLGDPRWAEANPRRTRLVQQLGLSMIQHPDVVQVARFLDLLVGKARDDWRVAAVLAGAVSTRPAGQPKQLSKPAVFVQNLQASDDAEDRRLADVLLAHVRWGDNVRKEIEPLTAGEQTLFEAGRAAYATTCAACHQANGQGLQGVAPSLVGSPWVTGDPAIPASIVLQGVNGPIEVHGEKWNLAMPGLGSVYSEEQVAAILTYIRREWGNTASAVSVAEVVTHREATRSRQALWTAEELLQMSAARLRKP